MDFAFTYAVLGGLAVCGVTLAGLAVYVAAGVLWDLAVGIE